MAIYPQGTSNLTKTQDSQADWEQKYEQADEEKVLFTTSMALSTNGYQLTIHTI